jgi:hypothetical protein
VAEIVNLRRARKANARATKERQAGENRAAFGRTKAERAAAQATKDGLRRATDGARLDGQKREK